MVFACTCTHMCTYTHTPAHTKRVSEHFFSSTKDEHQGLILARPDLHYKTTSRAYFYFETVSCEAAQVGLKLRILLSLSPEYLGLKTRLIRFNYNEQ